jgi:hypothetical protein
MHLMKDIEKLKYNLSSELLGCPMNGAKSLTCDNFGKGMLNYFTLPNKKPLGFVEFYIF